MSDPTPASVWYAFLAHLADLKSPKAVCRLDGMPREQAFARHMARDAVFAERVNALWVRKKIGADRWERLLELLETHCIAAACNIVGVNKATLNRRKSKDHAYRARVEAVLFRPDLRHLHFRATASDQTVWDAVIAHLASGMTVAEIAAKPGMPAAGSIFRKITDEPDYGARAGAARGKPFRRLTRFAISPDDDRAIWTRFLDRLEDVALLDLVRQSNMPTIDLFYKRRREDAEFDQRVRAIFAHKEGVPRRLTPEEWQSFITGLETCASVVALCGQPGMPSTATVYARAKRDQRFRSLLSGALRRRQRARLEAALIAAGKKLPRRRAARSTPRPVTIENFQVALSRDELYAAVAAAVPTGLPPITRDDIICDMMLAVLEGQLDVGQLKANAKEYVREHWRMFGTLKDISLDATIFDDSGATLGDRMAGHGADYW